MSSRGNTITLMLRRGPWRAQPRLVGLGTQAWGPRQGMVVVWTKNLAGSWREEDRVRNQVEAEPTGHSGFYFRDEGKRGIKGGPQVLACASGWTVVSFTMMGKAGTEQA